MQLNDLPEQHNSIGRMREEFFGSAIIERLRVMFPREDFSGRLSTTQEDIAGVDYWITKKNGQKTIQLGIDFTVSQRSPKKAKNLTATRVEITSGEDTSTYNRFYIFLTFSRYYRNHERAQMAELEPSEEVLGNSDPVNISSGTLEEKIALWEQDPKYPIVIGELHGEIPDGEGTYDDFQFIAQIQVALLGMRKRDELLAKLVNPSPR